MRVAKYGGGEAQRSMATRAPGAGAGACGMKSSGTPAGTVAYTRGKLRSPLWRRSLALWVLLALKTLTLSVDGFDVELSVDGFEAWVERKNRRGEL